jgi:hypothetical protein
MRHFLVVLALLFAAPPGRTDDKPPEVPANVKDKLGERTLAVLRGATRVEAFRVVADRDPKADEKQVGGYPVTATAKEQGKEFTAQLAPLLLDERTWFSKRQYKCFEPGVAYRLSDGKESVEVIICFKCRDLRLTTRDADGKEVQKAFGHFEDALFEPLAKAARVAFPDDKEIQGLSADPDKK